MGLTPQAGGSEWAYRRDRQADLSLQLIVHLRHDGSNPMVPRRCLMFSRRLPYTMYCIEQNGFLCQTLRSESIVLWPNDTGMESLGDASATGRPNSRTVRQ